MSDVVVGSCLCGAVQIEVTGAPKWCAYCHCSLCRRANGAGQVPWVGLRRDQVRFLAGEDALVTYAATPYGRRRFCGRCGTQLLFEGDRWPDELHVTRPAFPDDWPVRPQAHAYFTDKAPWVDVHDDLRKIPTPT